MAQIVKILPAKQETRVQSLGQGDPLGKEWLLTPVFLPGEFHGQKTLVGYSPWGRKESDTTEQVALCLYVVYILCKCGRGRPKSLLSAHKILF